MSTYEFGFALGERRAFDDRKAGKTPAARGYADGYMPRDSVWWVPGHIEPLDTVHEVDRSSGTPVAVCHGAGKPDGAGKPRVLPGDTPQGYAEAPFSASAW